MSIEKTCFCVMRFLALITYMLGGFELQAQQKKTSIDSVLLASQQEESHGTVVGKEVGKFLRDAALLQTKLFDWDTIKVLVGTLPVFIGARMIDENVHSHFYDHDHHKNICQMHNACYEVAKNSLAVPIVLLGSGVIWSKDEEFRETSRMFLVGMPFVIWSKEIIKKWQSPCCKRPWNEKYSHSKQSYGGFPSGHMAEIVYSTVLFGKRLGPKVGVPLGILSAFLGITFVNCNRHYVSQLVAGAALGTMYALAADKLISTNLEKRHAVDVGVGLNDQGGPELKVAFSF